MLFNISRKDGLAGLNYQIAHGLSKVKCKKALTIRTDFCAVISLTSATLLTLDFLDGQQWQEV